MILEKEDFTSGTWKRLVMVLEARIAVLQKELEQDLDDVKTALVRGRIKELRRLLTEGKEPLEFKDR